MKSLVLKALWATLVLMPLLGQTPARAAAGEGPRSIMSLEAGTGRVLTLASPVANIFVADPKVAEVRPASPTSLFIFGLNAGRTTIAVLDAEGQLLVQYELTVQPSSFSAHEAQAAINRLLPSNRVKVHAQGKGLMLSGSVRSPADAAQVMAIAKGYVAEGA